MHPENLERRTLLKTAAFAAFETFIPEAEGQGSEQAILKDVPPGPTVKVTVERRGQIVLFGINRPDIQNRIDPETSEQLGRAYYDYDQDATLRGHPVRTWSPLLARYRRGCIRGSRSGRPAGGAGQRARYRPARQIRTAPI